MKIIYVSYLSLAIFRKLTKSDHKYKIPTDTSPINPSVNKLELFTDTLDYHHKNKPFLSYDDSSFQPPTLVEADSTDSSVFLLGMLPLQHVSVMKRRMRNPITTIMDQKLFCKTLVFSDHLYGRYNWCSQE